MLLMLSVHPSRRSDLLCDDKIEFSPKVQARDFKDAFGNICTRLVAPTGLLEIHNEFIIADSGQPDIVATDAEQWPIDALPDDALTYLLGSRYCDTQKLTNHAWSLFGHIQGGWARAQAICQYVMNASSSDTTMPEMPDRVGRASRACRRMSRLRAARYSALPVHEHPGPLLYRLSGGYRRATSPSADGFQRVV
jgi:hypothetical protein